MRKMIATLAALAAFSAAPAFAQGTETKAPAGATETKPAKPAKKHTGKKKHHAAAKEAAKPETAPAPTK